MIPSPMLLLKDKNFLQEDSRGTLTHPRKGHDDVHRWSSKGQDEKD